MNENDFRGTPIADLTLSTLAAYEDEITKIAATNPGLVRSRYPNFKPTVSQRAKKFWQIFQRKNDSELIFSLDTRLSIEPDPLLFPNAHVQIDGDGSPVFPTQTIEQVLQDAIENCEFLKTYYRATEKFLSDPALNSIYGGY